MKKALLIVCLLPALVFGQTPIGITPNSGSQGQDLEVFISGEYEFTDYSGTESYLRLFAGDYSSTTTTINISNNAWDWTWNPNVETYGFYSNVNIPANALEGAYDLQKKDCYWCSWSTEVYNAFTVEQGPYIQQFSPQEVLVNQSFSLTIIGENTNWLSASNLNVRVRRSNGSTYYPTDWSSYSNSLIIANFSSINITGNYTVEVYDEDMGWYGSSGLQILPDPQITDVSPNIAYAGQTLDVHISGSGCEFSSFSEWSGSYTYIVSDFRITNGEETYEGINETNNGAYWNPNYNDIYAELSIPQNANIGSYDVEVYDYSLSDWVVLEDGFTVEQTLAINWISPANATQGESVTVTINHTGISAESIWLENEYGYQIFAQNINEFEGEYTVVFDIQNVSTIGWYDIKAADGVFNDVIVLENAFEILPSPPTITLVNPNQLSVGETVTVTISGVNTDFIGYSGTNASFYFSNNENTIYPNNTTVFTDDVMQGEISIPNNESYIGNYDVVVNDPSYGELLYDTGFSVWDPEGPIGFGQYYDINNNLINFDAISLDQEIVFYFSCFSYLDETYYYEFLEPIYNNFGCNQEDVFVVIIGAFTCGQLTNFVELTNTQIPIINLLNQADPLTDYFMIEYAPSVFFNDNQTELFSNEYSGEYSLYEDGLISLGAGLSPSCSEYNEPEAEINWISPNNASPGEDLNVTISGSNIDFYDCWEQWSDTYCDYSNFQLVFGDWSDSYTISGNIYDEWDNEAYASIDIPSNAPEGSYDVQVWDYNSDSWVTLNNGFEVYGYNEPEAEINWISPNNSYPGEDLQVTISGSNIDFYDCWEEWSDTYCDYSNFQLVFGDWSDSYTISGNIDEWDDAMDEVSASIDIPSNAPEGSYDVQVWDYNSDSWVTLNNGFGVYEHNEPEAEINWISPNNASAGEELNVTISGSNIDFYDCWEQWSDTYCDYSNFQLVFGDWSDSYTINGDIYDAWDNEVYASIYIPSNAPEGSYDVQVWDYNSDSWVTLNNGFEVVGEGSPIINYFDPQTLGLGSESGFDMSCSNVNYVGIPIWFHNEAGDSFYSNDSNEMYWYSEGSDTYIGGSVHVPTDVSSGYYDVSVLDTSTQEWVTLEHGVEIVPVPQIVNISPSEVESGSGDQEFEITISNVSSLYDYGFEEFYLATEWDWIYVDIQEVINDSTLSVSINIPNMSPGLLNDWYLYAYYQGEGDEYINIWGDQPAGITIVPLPCGSTYNIGYSGGSWDSYTNNATLCDGGIAEISINPSTNVPSEISQNLNFYWSTGEQNPLIEISQAGDYWIEIILDDTVTCFVDTIHVQEISYENFYTTEVVSPSCFGVNDATVQFIPNNGYMQIIDVDCASSLNTDNWSTCDELYGGNMPFTVSNLSAGSYAYALRVDQFSEDDFGECYIMDTIQISNPEIVFAPLPFTEEFENGIPCNWENSFATETYGNTAASTGWTFGEVSELEGSYWDIPAHGEFAISNDDLCNCDMFEERLISPPFDLSEESGQLLLEFATYFTGDYGSFAYVDVSTNEGMSWNEVYTVPADLDWQTIQLDISEYLGSSQLQFAFRHSDGHFWASGFAIDDVSLTAACLDDDLDGVCNEDEIAGCTNAEANNFNANATDDDDSCEYDIYGCTYPIAPNYNPDATIDDGSCEFDIAVCETPSGLFTTDVVHSRVTFNWATTGANYYKIKVSTDGGATYQVITQIGQDDGNPAGNTKTRYMMEANTCYLWMVRGWCIDGQVSSWSAPVEFCTLPACPNATDHEAVGVEGEWATLTWETPAETYQGVSHYLARIADAGAANWSFLGNIGDGTSKLKGALDQDASYDFETRTWCFTDENGGTDSYYKSDWGGNGNFTTVSCPVQTFNLETSQVNATTQWFGAEFAVLDPAADHYLLRIREAGSEVWEYRAINASHVAAGGRNVGLLSTGTEYEWGMRTYCSEGTTWKSPWTPGTSFIAGSSARAKAPIKQLSVYPNPSRDEFNISFVSEHIQTIQIQIVDVIGDKVYEERKENFIGLYKNTLNLSLQPKGVYFLQITTDNGGVNKKLILQ